MRAHPLLARLLAATSGALLTLLVPAVPAGATSPDVVISEAYGGGGNSGAAYTHDFVELYNRGANPVDLSGWSVQYASASGSTWQVTSLSGSIAAGGHYLVQLAAGSSGDGTAMPAPDATGSTRMSLSSGKVALVTSTGALGCGSICHSAPGVRDYLGYGSANDYETAPAATTDNSTSNARIDPAVDTDDNSADFAEGVPNPENSASDGGDGGGGSCDYPTPRIRDIQGTAHISPKQGKRVNDVRGVVTARIHNGFYLQDPCPDTDPATSEALFVYTGGAPSVGVGDEVSVRGRVSEYRGSRSSNLTITELTSPTVNQLGTRDLPEPTLIGTGGRVPPTTVIDDDATGDVETSGRFEPANDGIDFYESLEGMRVTLANPVAVGPTNRFGEIPVLADDGSGAGVRTARGGIVLRESDPNPERIMLDDRALSRSTPDVNVGDHFSGPAVGVMDYSFGNFKLQLTSRLSRVAGSLSPETAPAPAPGQLSVATFNVENLDAGDPQSKFDGLADAIVGNLRSPAILSIEEVQDNNGATNDGVVDASRTWAKLIDAIARAGGPAYDYRDIDPVDDADGGQPGGNIRVGFLFRADIGLSFVPGTAGDATTAVEPVATGDASDPVALSLNPGRIQPNDAAFDDSRKPIAGHFRYGGKSLFVIGNHFNSKGGDDPLFGHIQPPQRPSETQRNQQAKLVAGFYDKITAIDPDARVVVAGDLNDFEYSTAVRTLVSAGLTDLPAGLPDAERYTYVYQGNSQVLDHLMLSRSLAATSYTYDVVHINSEFTTQISDHEPQVVHLTLP